MRPFVIAARRVGGRGRRWRRCSSGRSTPIAPVLSLGVLYVFAVLPVAVAVGDRAGRCSSRSRACSRSTSSSCRRCTRSRCAESTNWFALAAYSVTAVVVSELAARSRRRATDAEQREREASLLAEIAGHLLARARRSRTSSTGSAGGRRGARCRARRDRARAAHRRARGRADAARGRRARRRHDLHAGRHAIRTSPFAAASCPRSRRCSPSRSTATGSSARRSKPRRCGGATSSRPRCSARCRTTCARR